MPEVPQRDLGSAGQESEEQMNDSATQSHQSVIVGSEATICVREIGRHGIAVFIESDGGSHRLQLSFFDALPLMTLINVLNTDETVRRFVDWRPDAEREVLVSPKFAEAMQPIKAKASWAVPGSIEAAAARGEDFAGVGIAIDDDATHPAQPPEPSVVFVGPLTANVRCLDCGRDFMSPSGTTNLERLASATLGYAAHWAREHGR